MRRPTSARFILRHVEFSVSQVQPTSHRSRWGLISVNYLYFFFLATRGIALRGLCGSATALFKHVFTGRKAEVSGWGETAESWPQGLERERLTMTTLKAVVCAPCLQCSRGQTDPLHSDTFLKERCGQKRDCGCWPTFQFSCCAQWSPAQIQRNVNTRY